MYEAFVIVYMGMQRFVFEDTWGPYIDKTHCHIRTEQMVRERVAEIFADTHPAIPVRIKQICVKRLDDELVGNDWEDLRYGGGEYPGE